MGGHGIYAGRAYDRSLGNRKFGKTHVDCGFLSSKSQWGILGEDPAGLLRLTLNLHEPAGYKLSSAEVNLCFLPTELGPSPSVTEYLYPDILCGPPLSQHKAHDNSIEPTVEAGGVSLGGVGRHSKSDWTETFRWQLRGSRIPDENNLYTKAEWLWQANRLNSQSELKRAFQLALVLAHSEPRMIATVAINGKLRQPWRRYRDAFGLIRPPPKVVPLEFSQNNVELAAIVKTLAAEMRRLNEAPVPEHTIPTAVTPAENTQDLETSENLLPPELNSIFSPV